LSSYIDFFRIYLKSRGQDCQVNHYQVVPSLYIFIIYVIFSKIEKNDLKNSKHSKFLYPIRFSYEEFNENHKLKFLRLIFFDVFAYRVKCKCLQANFKFSCLCLMQLMSLGSVC
jgi:hypothetical protein